MQKIMVIGSGGSGKSTFCKALHAKLGLPLVHLDREFFSPGWVEPDRETWANRMRELVAENAWILDGNYGGTMDIRFERADTVFFLAYSRWVCTYSILIRWWRCKWGWKVINSRLAGQTYNPRPDMAEGCEEKMEWQFISYVFRYNDTRRPGILKKLDKLRQDSEKKIYVFRKRKEAKKFLASLDPAVNDS